MLPVTMIVANDSARGKIRTSFSSKVFFCIKFHGNQTNNCGDVFFKTISVNTVVVLKEMSKSSKTSVQNLVASIPYLLRYIE